MIKFATAAFAAAILSTGAFAQGKPDNPGQAGQTKAAIAAGLDTSDPVGGSSGAFTANRQGVTGLAASIFGNNGRGNGSDPDPLGLGTDHDATPGGFGDLVIIVRLRRS